MIKQGIYSYLALLILLIFTNNFVTLASNTEKESNERSLFFDVFSKKQLPDTSPTSDQTQLSQNSPPVVPQASPVLMSNSLPVLKSSTPSLSLNGKETKLGFDTMPSTSPTHELTEIIVSLGGWTVVKRAKDIPLIESGSGTCEFATDMQVIFSHPMNIGVTDSLFITSRSQWKAIELMVDYINENRCGLKITTSDGSQKNVLVQLHTYGAKGDVEKVANITQRLVVNEENPTFFLGPYSSTLTLPQAEITDTSGKILVAGGAADTSIFQNRSLTFGTLIPSANYLLPAVELLRDLKVKTIASVFEDASFTAGVCASLGDELTAGLAQEYNITMVGARLVRRYANRTDFKPVVEEFKEINPEAVVTCVYEESCADWVNAMRIEDWSPKIQIFTVCVGNRAFIDLLDKKTDAQHITGISLWNEFETRVVDAVSQWTASDFTNIFESYTGYLPTYHAASAASTVSIIAQAIELAGEQWKNSTVVANIISQRNFSTLYGNIYFDENGQSKAQSLLLQYQSKNTIEDSSIEIISGEYKTADFIYPMPTWSSRDCSNNGLCKECNQSGRCICKYSVGYGETAKCIEESEFKYIENFLIYIGYIFVAIQGLCSLFCIVWTFYYQYRKAVKSSQPFFLYLIACGCFVMTSSIIPLTIEGKYRYSDSSSGFPEESLQSTKRLDIACMATPWLYFLGFSLVFTALFAKVMRICKIFEAGRSMRRVNVPIKDAMKMVAIFVSINVMILLVWTLVEPLIWTRTHIEENNYITNSVGFCSPESPLGFYLAMPLVFFEVACLIAALYISYKVRTVPGELAETKWISFCVIMILELLLFGVPIILIGYVQGNRNVFIFGLSATIFLQAFVVTQFIFAPKIYHLHFSDGIPKGERFTRRSAAHDQLFLSQMSNNSRSSIKSTYKSRGSQLSYDPRSSFQDSVAST